MFYVAVVNMAFLFPSILINASEHVTLLRSALVHTSLSLPHNVARESI